MAALGFIEIPCPECDLLFKVDVSLKTTVSDERYNFGTVTVEIETYVLGLADHEHAVEVERNV